MESGMHSVIEIESVYKVYGFIFVLNLVVELMGLAYVIPDIQYKAITNME